MNTCIRKTSSGQSTISAGGVLKPRSQWRQYLVTILVNISTFVAGTIYGWAAPMLPVLQSEDSPVGIPPITDDDGSWLASIYCVSRILTIPLYMYSIDRYGCKVTGYLIAAPFLLSYVMLLFANSMSMMFWARFITGIAAGGTGILAPSYTIDIAEDSNKGILNVIFGQSMNIGVVFSFTMGYYTSYTLFHVCCIIMTVISVFALCWLPESPLFLMTSGKTEQAIKVLKWLRNGEESEFEIERMKTRAQEVLRKRQQKISCSEIMDRRMLRGLLISVGLTTNQQLSGIGPIVAYTVTIFQQAGAAIPPHISTILIGVVQIFGTHLSSMAVERYGRRFLLIGSDIVISLCLFAVGSYFYVQSLGWNMETVGWLPISALLIYMLSTGIGLGPLPFTIATEMVHPNYRGVVQTANVMTLSITTFVSTLSYVPLINVVGSHGCFWIYAIICSVGTVLIYFLLPETKNRSLEDVLEQMGSDNFIRSVVYYKKESQNMPKHHQPNKV